MQWRSLRRWYSDGPPSNFSVVLVSFFVGRLLLHVLRCIAISTSNAGFAGLKRSLFFFSLGRSTRQWQAEPTSTHVTFKNEEDKCLTNLQTGPAPPTSPTFT